MRERVEDLGRLLVLLESIFFDDEWDVLTRKGIEDAFKDIIDDLVDKSGECCYEPNERDDETKLWRLLVHLNHMRDKIDHCLDIARGEDLLNQEE